jgi:hypothetical protein
MALLNEQAHRILAFINGHNHADHLDNDGAFPVVSIACSKCETEFEEKRETAFKEKPAGFIAPGRSLDEAAQECFDVMLVHPVKDTVRFIRFGAGEDRIIKAGHATLSQ